MIGPMHFLRSRAGRLVLLLIGSTLVGLYFSSQFYVNFAPDEPMRWQRALSVNLTYYYLWGAAVLLIVRAGRRWRLESAGWPGLLIRHLLLSILLTVGIIVIAETILSYISPDGRARPLPSAILYGLQRNFHSCFPTYWLILFVYYAFDYYAKYRDRELRATQLAARLTTSQLEALRMQLNPHFLFNTLNSISSLMYTNVDAADAMITRLGDFLRMTLETDTAQEVPLRRATRRRPAADRHPQRPSAARPERETARGDRPLEHPRAPGAALRRGARAAAAGPGRRRAAGQPVDSLPDRLMSTLRTIVVDDERLARQKIRTLLAKEADVEVVRECGNGDDAIAAIRQERPDLVFLDVQMPGMDGFSVVRALGAELTSTIVFVTAHEQYAVRAFEVHALDYLLKPFDRARLRLAVERARHQQGSGDHQGCARRIAAMVRDLGQSGYIDRLTIRLNNRVFFVRTEEIDWIEAADNYACVHHGDSAHLVRETMAALESSLDPKHFVRIHRSAIVRVDRIDEIRTMVHGDHVVILRNGKELPFGRTYRERLQELLRR
jgi:two-component system LytT family response regulator